MTGLSQLKLVGDAAESLIEHFDSVLILASGPSADGHGTAYYRTALGNAHANEGIAREYLRRLESYEAAYHGEAGRFDAVKARKPPEGEGWKEPEE